MRAQSCIADRTARLSSRESERAEWSGSARRVLEYFGTRAAGMASSKREEGMKEANIPAAYAAEGDAPRACKFIGRAALAVRSDPCASAAASREVGHCPVTAVAAKLCDSCMPRGAADVGSAVAALRQIPRTAAPPVTSRPRPTRRELPSHRMAYSSASEPRSLLPQRVWSEA